MSDETVDNRCLMPDCPYRRAHGTQFCSLRCLEDYSRIHQRVVCTWQMDKFLSPGTNGEVKRSSDVAERELYRGRNERRPLSL
jgi:hypothetical protein